MSLSVLVVVGPSAGGIGTHVRDLVDELPRTPTGKLVKRRIVQQYA